MGIALAATRWSSLTLGSRRTLTSNARRIQLAAFAVFLTFLIELLWSSGAGHARSLQSSMPIKPAPKVGDLNGTRKVTSDYIGIILLPPKVKKERVIQPPPPEAMGSRIAGPAKPITIPFDGPYWYFKAPHNQPGNDAHIAQGKPTALNIHSSDGAPLLMEAHQDIGLPLDLNRYREIDIALTNADTRPGPITLSLLLTDSKSRGTRSLSLGDRLIVSSQSADIPLTRPAIKEVLHFPIPPASTLSQFDKITVIFRPNSRRAVAGAKVAIDTFVLIPR